MHRYSIQFVVVALVWTVSSFLDQKFWEEKWQHGRRDTVSDTWAGDVGTSREGNVQKLFICYL